MSRPITDSRGLFVFELVANASAELLSAGIVSASLTSAEPASVELALAEADVKPG